MWVSRHENADGRREDKGASKEVIRSLKFVVKSSLQNKASKVT